MARGLSKSNTSARSHFWQNWLRGRFQRV